LQLCLIHQHVFRPVIRFFCFASYAEGSYLEVGFEAPPFQRDLAGFADFSDLMAVRLRPCDFGVMRASTLPIALFASLPISDKPIDGLTTGLVATTSGAASSFGLGGAAGTAFLRAACRDQPGVLAFAPFARRPFAIRLVRSCDVILHQRHFRRLRFVPDIMASYFEADRHFQANR
jgi:hypothetical protein